MTYRMTNLTRTTSVDGTKILCIELRDTSYDQSTQDDENISSLYGHYLVTNPNGINRRLPDIHINHNLPIEYQQHISDLRHYYRDNFNQDHDARFWSDWTKKQLKKCELEFLE